MVVAADGRRYYISTESSFQLDWGDKLEVRYPTITPKFSKIMISTQGV